MNETIRRENIERGLQAHQAGRYDEALNYYRVALEAVRGDAEALSMSGLALLHLGQLDRAMPLLQRAVDQEPAQPGFRFNLAEGLDRTRQYDRARREIQVILDAQPENWRAWDRAGDLAARMGDEIGAGEGWAKAFTLNLAFVTTALKLAQLQIGRERFDLALKVIDAALGATPGHEPLLALKCEAHIAGRDWNALQATATDWLNVHPESAAPWRIAARALFEQGRHVEAANAFSRVLALTAPPTAADLAAYASLSLHALNYEASDLALAGAEALEPDNADMLATRALLHMYFGRFAEAASCSRRSLDRAPGNVSAYSTLSRLQRGHLSDVDRETVTQLAQRADLPLDLRIPAAFIAAHACDARGDIDAAMTGYERAHAMARQRDQAEGRGYDPQAVEGRVQRLRELSAIPLPAPSMPGAPRPVFIVGMPRSGTTLVESVLAAHSRVVGLGERPTMRQIQRAALALDAEGRSPDAATLQSWWAAYFHDLPPHLPPMSAADHITDKHPLNFEAAGLITQLFPNAVIVHVRRDPIETCLSIYRQEFNKHWTFAHRFADIAHYYGCYAKLVAYWEHALASRFVTIQYEDLTADFASVAPRLLRSCGLDWEPQCLNFQEAVRPIATFSTVQARDPVRSGNGRAARYGKHLASLAEALERG